MMEYVHPQGGPQAAPQEGKEEKAKLLELPNETYKVLPLNLFINLYFNIFCTLG